jgi:hypothetical protein
MLFVEMDFVDRQIVENFGWFACGRVCGFSSNKSPTNILTPTPLGGVVVRRRIKAERQTQNIYLADGEDANCIPSKLLISSRASMCLYIENRYGNIFHGDK